MDSTVASLTKPHKRSAWSSAPAFPTEAFDELVERIVARGHDVPASIARLADGRARSRCADAVA